jgi:hypothetical protein
MTSFNRCPHSCCSVFGQCCGCCGKTRIADPEVRAAYAKLQGTFRRMEAIEARCVAAIATLKEEEEAGAGLGAPVAPFNAQVANAIETLRTLRTWP